MMFSSSVFYHKIILVDFTVFVSQILSCLFRPNPVSFFAVTLQIFLPAVSIIVIWYGNDHGSGCKVIY
jgi:hypothetical protein